MDAHGFFTEPAQELATVGDLAIGLGEWFSHLDCHEQGEIVRVFLDEFPSAAQNFTAGARCGLGPAVLCGHSGVECADRVFGGGVGHLPDDVTCGRIAHGKHAAGRGIDPLTIDEQPIRHRGKQFGFTVGYNFLHRSGFLVDRAHSLEGARGPGSVRPI